MSRMLKTAHFSLRRGIGPLAVAAILAVLGIVASGVIWALTSPAEESGVGPVQAAVFLESVEYKFYATYFLGVPNDLLLNVTVNHNASSNVDVYVLIPDIADEDNYLVFHSASDVSSGESFTMNYNPRFIILAIDDEMRIDAIVCNASDMDIGEARTSTEHYPDPEYLAQFIKVKRSWWDVIWEWWTKTWGLSTAFQFTFNIVIVFIPLAGTLWTLWFMSSIISCFKNMSIEPVMDFFYKNYSMIYKIVSTVVNIVLKIVDLVTGPLS